MVPLRRVGVVLALLATGDTLNIMSLIGVILLMGVVATNAPLLLDFANLARDVALVAGMTPIAFGTAEGGDFRAPLGRVVIGGVLTSTVLTLLVVPTVYEILDEARGWLIRRVGGWVGHEPVRPPVPESTGMRKRDHTP